MPGNEQEDPKTKQEQDPKQDPKETNDPKTGTGPGEQDPKTGEEVSFTPEQQAHIDKVIGDRLARARKKWEEEADEAKKKAAEEAEQRRLAEQKEFEQLANKRAEMISELEVKLAEFQELEKTVERYKTALQTHLETQRAGLPEHVTALLDKLDPVEQLEYVASHNEALRKGTAGVPPTPPSGKRGLDQLTEDERRQRSAGVRNVW